MSKLSLAEGLLNHFVEKLPGDSEIGNFPRQVEAACYSEVRPKKPSAPQLLHTSKPLAAELGMSVASDDNAFLAVVSGQDLPEHIKPYAQCYGGHQFGHWAGQLGDGRAINIGEWRHPKQGVWSLQLKGAGPTPYSRTADGLAVLRSSVREYVCSEAMYHLGIPTTRALSLVSTGDDVVRDMLYDGNPMLEPGAIVCRAAPSFLRFGSYQLFAARGDRERLETLVDYTLKEFYPQIDSQASNRVELWFAEVCRRTLSLVLDWYRVGFVHGVLNTDNMSILGLTIDYGPYGWIDNFDVNWTPNTTDAQGRRYRFGHQGQIAAWNLLQLANAIAPLAESVPAMEASLEAYVQNFQSGWLTMMTKKLGYDSTLSEDLEQIQALEKLLQDAEIDMTIFYRCLAELKSDVSFESKAQWLALIEPACYQRDFDLPVYDALGEWLKNYQARLSANSSKDDQRKKAMNAYNPKFVFRNYIGQQVIDALESGDEKPLNEVMAVLARPYDEQPESAKYAERRPDWAKDKVGCSMLSCSS